MALDLADLLATPRPGRFDMWLDVAAPTTAAALSEIDLDGRRHGGLPLRFDGRTLVRMRHLPGSEAGRDLACGLEAARGWALQQMRGNLLVRIDYEVPWTLAVQLAQRAVSGPPRLQDLLALATRQGDWLSDFIGEHAADDAVQAIVDADLAAAAAAGVTEAPTISISEQTIPAQTAGLHDQVARLLV